MTEALTTSKVPLFIIFFFQFLIPKGFIWFILSAKNIPKGDNSWKQKICFIFVILIYLPLKSRNLIFMSFSILNYQA